MATLLRSNEFRARMYRVGGFRGVHGHWVGLKMSKVNACESLFVLKKERTRVHGLKNDSLKPAR